MNQYTNAQFYIKIEESAAKKGYRVSPGAKSYFVKLYNYVNEHGFFDKTKNMFYIDKSLKDLAADLGLAERSVRTWTKQLEDCECIKRLKSTTDYRTLLIYINEDIFKED